MDWFRRLYEGRESFDHEEEALAYRQKQRALTRSEVECLCRLSGIAPGSTILDAYCGNGRHALEMAHRGFTVIGVDVALSRIVFARNWARDEGARAAFLAADTRYLPFSRAFDAVVILGGSFTHCRAAEENVALLKGLRDVLRSGGRILIDNPNPLRFWRAQHPRATETELRALRYFDLPLGKGESFGHVRYYGAEQMNRLFTDADLGIAQIYGDWKGSPYAYDSPRMIVVGQDPGDCSKEFGAVN